VAALGKEADALELAARLQKKKFPAFVVFRKQTKYYRVQVGPYADPKPLTRPERPRGRRL